MRIASLPLQLLMALPLGLAVLGAAAGTLVFLRRYRTRTSGLVGALAGAALGLNALFLPYALLRACGCFYPYYSQGHYSIECADGCSDLAGAVWLMTYGFHQYDAKLCEYLLPAPPGG